MLGKMGEEVAKNLQNIQTNPPGDTKFLIQQISHAPRISGAIAELKASGTRWGRMDRRCLNCSS